MNKFMIIWAGQFISNIGSGMTAFAISVYVFQLTGSVAWVSAITLLAHLPTVLLSPMGGILADRFDRRLMMICGDLFSALGLLYILLSIQSGHGGLTPIVVGVTINAIFVSLLDPSYKATVTDLLTQEEYAKASGMVQMASNARYLISPAVAGVILGFSDIRVILVIDILTIAVTVLAVAFVKKEIKAAKPREDDFDIGNAFKSGVQHLTKDRGVADLVLLMSGVCFFIGCVQILMIPMILPIGNVKSVGFMESISAIGMLVSSVAIGIFGIKGQYHRVFVISLIACGAFMALMGVSTKMWFILLTSFLFFATLPFANTCADVLIRVRIPNELQGRVWGLIGLLTQFGYVLAYAVSGVLADQLFVPMLQADGILSHSVGRLIGTGDGRGIGLMLIVAGVCMVALALTLGNQKSIRAIEVTSYGHQPKDLEE